MFTMTPSPNTYSLTLTLPEADYVIRLLSIGQLALAEHTRSGWVPARPVDATQMTELVKALRTVAPIDRPIQGLTAWVQTQRKK
jgi:hypothetical protein